MPDKLTEKLDVRLTTDLYKRVLEEAENLTPPPGRAGRKDMKGEVVRAALVAYFGGSKTPQRLNARQRQLLALETLLKDVDPDLARDWARAGGIAADHEDFREALKALVALVAGAPRGRSSRSKNRRSRRPRGHD